MFSVFPVPFFISPFSFCFVVPAPDTLKGHMTCQKTYLGTMLQGSVESSADEKIRRTTILADVAGKIGECCKEGFRVLEDESWKALSKRHYIMF